MTICNVEKFFHMTDFSAQAVVPVTNIRVCLFHYHQYFMKPVMNSLRISLFFILYLSKYDCDAGTPCCNYKNLPGVSRRRGRQQSVTFIKCGYKLVVRSCHFDVTACAEARRLDKYLSDRMSDQRSRRKGP